jgi:hypothetical protein
MEVVHNEGLMPDAGEILFPNAPFRYSGCKKSFVNPIVVTLGTTVDLCSFKLKIIKYAYQIMLFWLRICFGV